MLPTFGDVKWELRKSHAEHGMLISKRFEAQKMSLRTSLTDCRLVSQAGCSVNFIRFPMLPELLRGENNKSDFWRICCLLTLAAQTVQTTTFVPSSILLDPRRKGVNDSLIDVLEKKPAVVLTLLLALMRAYALNSVYRFLHPNISVTQPAHKPFPSYPK